MESADKGTIIPEDRDTIAHSISRFVHVLRHLGVRVSLSETMDAVYALEEVNILNRHHVQVVLRACLAKSKKEAGIFDTAFDLFFTTYEEKLVRQKLRNERQQEREHSIDMAEQELMDALGECQQDLPSKVTLTDQQLETFSRLPNKEKEKMKEILRQMKSNPVNNPAELINKVIQSALNYWHYYMLRNMTDNEPMRDIPAEMPTGDDELDEIIEKVSSQHTQKPDRFLNKDMKSLDDSDISRMTALINHFSKQLSYDVSRRYKQSSGAVSIDIRRTVRTNVRYGGIPIQLRYRRRRKKKPQFLLICDVSASMARYARFVLQFVYGLSSSLTSIESFVFAEDLERITPYFRRGKDFTISMTEIVNGSKQWGKATDLCTSLGTFQRLYRDRLFPDTIVIIVSDTKTVSPVGAAKLLRELKLRCRDVIWLNTLSPREWDLAPVKVFNRIADMYACNTLFQLEKVFRSHVLKKI